MHEVIRAIAAWSGFIFDPKTRKLLAAVVSGLLDLVMELRHDEQRHCLLEALEAYITKLRQVVAQKHYGTFPMATQIESGKLTGATGDERHFKPPPNRKA